jgi:hypothetical protein
MKAFTADREFIGQEWFEFLIQQKNSGYYGSKEGGIDEIQ